MMGLCIFMGRLVCGIGYGLLKIFPQAHNRPLIEKARKAADGLFSCGNNSLECIVLKRIDSLERAIHSPLSACFQIFA